jgi:hypothetical protein
MSPGGHYSYHETSAAAFVPRAKTCADCALQALIVAGAFMLHVRGGGSAAARMQLLICARRSGLLAAPAQCNVIAELDALLDEFRTHPASLRRIMVQAMNAVVGSPWAPAVLDSADQICLAAGPITTPTRQARRALSVALGLARATD